jgi:hypothetical protein
MISGKFSWYDLVMLIGLVLTAIRMAVQYHSIKRVENALGDARAEVERLLHMHPSDGPEHPPEYSPGEGPVTEENP